MGLLLGALRAETREYLLDVADREDASFQVRFGVEHGGTVVVTATWSGPRVLSFRLEGPDTRIHRSGPSPQQFRFEVAPSALLPGERWTLDIRALAARGRAEGSVSIELPGEPVSSDPAPPPPAPPSREAEPWMLPRSAPEGAAREIVRVFEAVEALRAAAVGDGNEVLVDPCGWHEDLLRWLTAERDRAGEGGQAGDPGTSRYVKSLATAVRQVDALRDPDDPILAGPEPEERLARRVWLVARKERTRPVESNLDALRERLQRRYAPELLEQEWPPRFLACLTACERHFEQRARLGDDAANREIADQAWGAILAAAEAFDALAALAQEDAGKDELAVP